MPDLLNRVRGEAIRGDLVGREGLFWGTDPRAERAGIWLSVLSDFRRRICQVSRVTRGYRAGRAPEHGARPEWRPPGRERKPRTAASDVRAAVSERVRRSARCSSGPANTAQVDQASATALPASCLLRGRTDSKRRHRSRRKIRQRVKWNSGRRMSARPAAQRRTTGNPRRWVQARLTPTGRSRIQPGSMAAQPRNRNGPDSIVMMVVVLRRRQESASPSLSGSQPAVSLSEPSQSQTLLAIKARVLGRAGGGRGDPSQQRGTSKATVALRSGNRSKRAFAFEQRGYGVRSSRARSATMLASLGHGADGFRNSGSCRCWTLGER